MCHIISDIRWWFIAESFIKIKFIAPNLLQYIVPEDTVHSSICRLTSSLLWIGEQSGAPVYQLIVSIILLPQVLIDGIVKVSCTAHIRHHTTIKILFPNDLPPLLLSYCCFFFTLNGSLITHKWVLHVEVDVLCPSVQQS